MIYIHTYIHTYKYIYNYIYIYHLCSTGPAQAWKIKHNPGLLRSAASLETHQTLRFACYRATSVVRLSTLCLGINLAQPSNENKHRVLFGLQEDVGLCENRISVNPMDSHGLYDHVFFWGVCGMLYAISFWDTPTCHRLTCQAWGIDSVQS